VTDGPRLDLLRPRDIGGLFRDAFNAYARHFVSFIAIGAAVVVPVELVVSGLGLGELSGSYSSTGTGPQVGVSLAEGYLLVNPLITAMVIHALLAVADGRRPKPGAAIVSGLEAFRPIFVAVLIGAAGVFLGFIALIIPGIWLLVRWYFAPQAVVVDGRRGIRERILVASAGRCGLHGDRRPHRRQRGDHPAERVGEVCRQLRDLAGRADRGVDAHGAVRGADDHAPLFRSAGAAQPSGDGAAGAASAALAH
jgi:hypothetical protein